MRSRNGDLYRHGPRAALAGAALLCLAAALASAGCGGGGPGGVGPPPDPERDGCAPYDYYAEDAVPVRRVAAWIGGLIEDLAVDGDLAVLASRAGGLRVVDVSTPAVPRLLGAADGPPVYGVALQGSLAAAAEGDRGFALYDLADPAAPSLLARVRVTGPGESSHYTDTVLLAGSRLFVAGYHRQLVCFDIGDPRRPVERGRLVLDRPGDLAVVGSRLFAGGKAVVAVSAKGGLTLLQDLGQGAAEDLLVRGDRLHAAVAAGLATFDLSDPDTVLLADLRPVGRARCLAAAGDLVFLGSAPPNARLKVYDYGAGDVPALLADRQAAGYVGFYALAHADGVLLAGDRWLRTIAVGAPAAPVFAAAPREPAYPQGLAVVGTRALVADGPQASVYDLAAPVGQAPLAVHDLGQSILYLAANSSRVFLVRNASGLLVLDPAGTAPPQALHTPYWFGPLAASDSLLVTGYGGKVRIYDLADPAVPRYRGDIDFGDYVRQIAIDGSRVLVSLASAHLVLLDVTDPDNPVEVARDLTGLQLRDSAAVAWTDSVGYDFHQDGLLRVVRPDSGGVLRTVAALATEGEARSLAARGPVLYALGGVPWGGASYLTALDVTAPASPRVIGRAVQPEAMLITMRLAGDHAWALTAGGVLRYWLDCRSFD